MSAMLVKYTKTLIRVLLMYRAIKDVGYTGVTDDSLQQ